MWVEEVQEWLPGFPGSYSVVDLADGITQPVSEQIEPVGQLVDGLRTVLSGLQPGERIVVNGLQRVRPGDVVQPQVVPMNARAETPAVAVAKS